jgi:acyl-CoA hydrolase/GNAT superfamily N-acetyltransferase
MTSIPEQFQHKVLSPDEVIDKIKPGSRVFLSSGPATPITMITELIESKNLNVQDLEIIQLITLIQDSDELDFETYKFRLKTFNVGESINREVQRGNVDFIPANLIEIPAIFSSGSQGVDVAFIQTTPPDERGYMRLGIAVDVANIVIKTADLVIAEVNDNVPVTYGETMVHIDQVHHLVESDKPLITRNNKPIDEVLDRMGWHISNLIQDGATVVLHVGRIFDAIAKHLQTKKNLGVMTHVVSDWIMDLVESGAIAKDRSRFTGGQVTTSYCFGSDELYKYVNRNPLFEFHPIAILANPFVIKRVHRLISIMNVKRIDVSGESVIFHSGDNLLSGYESKLNFAVGANFSRNGKAIVTLRSTGKDGESNIVLSHKDEDAGLLRSTLGVTRYVVTEYGVANLFGKSIRERVLAMIDIAHPTHRVALLEKAKELGYAYADQIYNLASAELYPYNIETTKMFRDGLEVRIRPIKPSDEDMMRRLFYQFSDEARYFRYFTRKALMPHKEMQKYVSVDYENILSVVGIVHKGRSEKIIAEARYAYDKFEDNYEMAFVVDEDYQGKGIATFLLNYLIRIAKERGIKKLCAYVLPENESMIKVFKKACIPSETSIEDGAVVETIDLTQDDEVGAIADE